MIILSNAHHLRHPGASNSKINLNEYEYSCEINRRIHNLMIINKLPEPVYILDTSWKTSYKEALREKVRIINSLKPKFVMENHLNSSEFEEVTGCETLYYKDSIKGEKLASIIHKRITSLREIKIDRGIKERTDLILLGGTICPTIITEPIFISNRSSNLLLDEKFLDKLTKKIVEGIKEFLEGI